jgi:hypothetical protein
LPIGCRLGRALEATLPQGRDFGLWLGLLGLLRGLRGLDLRLLGLLGSGREALAIHFERACRVHPAQMALNLLARKRLFQLGGEVEDFLDRRPLLGQHLLEEACAPSLRCPNIFANFQLGLDREVGLRLWSCP